MARLEVITGPMSSGKSEELARRLRRATYVNKRIVVIKPSQDDRNTRNIFIIIKEDERLKNYERLATQSLSHAKELRNLVDAFNPDILALDEAQLFDSEIVEYLTELLEEKQGKNFVIIAAGLDMDWRTRGFRIMPELMARADEVLKLTAICLQCQGEYGPAIFTQKKGGTSEQIEIGDVGTLYEARCRMCHYIPS